jgi:hypothetical protein
MYRFHTGFFPMGIIYLWYGIDISLVWELYIDRFFYGTGSVQGFLHLGFRPIFIKKTVLFRDMYQFHSYLL